MERLDEERQFWEAIDWVPDLQCAWQILVHCAGSRCHHFVRTVPPSESRAYAEGHDTGMIETMRLLLGGLTGNEAQKHMAQSIATLPMRLGGLGLRSASRMSLAEYWASWADSLQMIAHRLPTVDDQEAVGCLAELEEATRRLGHEGFVSRPEWTDLRDGARPPQVQSSEPGEWQHGWQYHASSSSEHHYRQSVVLAQSSAADQAHLRSHSGPGASSVLLGCPSACEFQIQPETFRALTLERLRLPLHVTDAQCECGAPVDHLGRHRGACTHSDHLKPIPITPERTLVRVCREAGALFRFNVKLRDMNVAVPADDDRAIEVWASGLPMQHVAQLAIDITLRSATSANGLPQRNAAHIDGAVLTRARADKEAKYAELVGGNQCFLVVVALEIGGRWSGDAVEFIDMMAVAPRAGGSPNHAEVSPLGVATPWWLLVRTCGVALTARHQTWLTCWERPEVLSWVRRVIGFSAECSESIISFAKKI